MRRVFHSEGFLICFLVNLLFRAEWFGLAVIAYVLHLIFHFTVLPAVILLVVWVLVALGVTLFLGLVNRLGNTPTPERPNLNPYSGKNTDYGFPPRH